MISVNEAFNIIAAQKISLKKLQVSLLDSLNHKIAVDVFSDSDLPPFNRVMMDGIAIRFAELDSFSSFKIEGIQAAGKSSSFNQTAGSCIEIMTGAVLPTTFDTVIPYEDIVIDSGVAMIQIAPKKMGAHVHLQGTDVKKGDCLIQEGQLLSPAEIGILASVGISQPWIYAAPNIAVVSTGDELVEINQVPLPYQIRKSNVYAIQAALKKELRCDATLFHVSDDASEIKTQLATLLSRFEIVILSGGVSKGKFDLIPSMLQELHVKQAFHRIKQKPGKPFWFGVGEHNLVFALPGNPVSTLVCAYRYVIPFLNSHLRNKPIEFESKKLDCDYVKKGSLTYFLPVRITPTGVVPVEGNGSGDFAHLANVDGWLELPEESNEIKKGDTFRYLPFRF